ncbi:MAG: HAD family acid phosphatase [PVC group bacterium]
MMKDKMKLMSLFLLALLLAVPAAEAAGSVTLPNDIAWVMSADTYKECVQQAYLNAMNRLTKLAEGKEAGTWCVVLDADETIISNVRFQAELAVKKQSYSKSAWNAWCSRGEAPVLPGVIEYLSLVQKLGGKVIIITNRQSPLREPTVKNLKEQGIHFDLCLLREGLYQDDRTKVMRRTDIEKGTVKDLPPGVKLPPLEILMLAGDQTHDLYDKGSFEDVKDRFGKDLIILPNPMYGDWTEPAADFHPSSSAGLAPVPGAAPPAAAAAPEEAAITWQEAMDRIGDTVTVEAAIVNVYDPAARGKGGPVKLNTDRSWDESLTIVLFNKDGKFGDPARFNGKRIRARGKVGTFQDAVQLTVFGPDDIEILE